MSWLAATFALVAAPLLVLSLLWRVRGRLPGGSEDDLHRSDGLGAIANGLMIPAWTLLHVYWLAGFSAFAALMFAWDWWRRRKRRKRSPKALGAKSRALIAALVRKVRENAKPRPLLRPLPGGVR